MSERDVRKAEVLSALEAVKDPETGQDIVSRGFVSYVAHCEGACTVTLVLKTDAPPVLATVKSQAEAALRALPWVTDATVKFDTGPADAFDHGGSEMAVIAVGSGKGGVGKSTVAANLATALAKGGAKVGLLDADIYGPSIPTMLGANEHPAVVEEDGKKQLRPVEAHGVKLMSMGFMVEPDRAVIWRGPMLHQALRQFFSDVAWGHLDYLVIDLPPGTGDVALTLTQSVTLTGAIIVSTPQQVAMLDARKALSMFKQTNVPILGIVENMSGDIFGKGGAERWAKEQDVPCLGSIPLEMGIRESGDSGTPAALSKSPAVSGPWDALALATAARIRSLNGGTEKRKPISIKR